MRKGADQGIHAWNVVCALQNLVCELGKGGRDFVSRTTPDGMAHIAISFAALAFEAPMSKVAAAAAAATIALSSPLTALAGDAAVGEAIFSGSKPPPPPELS